MKEHEIIEEMIDLFFVKKRRERMKYVFSSKEKRREAYFRYNSGDYIDKSFIKYQVNKLSMQDIYKMLIEEGGNKKCFMISCSESGLYNTEDALKRAMNNGLGAMLYLGNGVGYFQGEQYIGSPERYILVNDKKKSNPVLFE